MGEVIDLFTGRQLTPTNVAYEAQLEETVIADIKEANTSSKSADIETARLLGRLITLHQPELPS